MASHLHRACAGIVLCVLLNQPASTQPLAPSFWSAFAGSHQSANAQGLLTMARTAGTLPVIVQLDAAAESSAEASKLGDRAIGRAQQRLLQEVTGIEPTLAFRHIPFIALRASEATLRSLMGHPLVIGIQVDEPYEVMLRESTESIGAPSAWSYGGTGAGQVVAVIDTGVDGQHPFLAGKLVDEACFSTSYSSANSNFESISTCPDGADEAYGAGAAGNCDSTIAGCDHGTRVAGIVAGKGESFSGVAKEAGLMAIQVFSRFENYCGSTPCIRSWVSDQVAALEYVYEQRDRHPIAAVNLSLGGGHYTTEEGCDEVNPAMRAIIEMLHAEEIAVVAAAGNSGLTDGLVAPACLSNSMSVGATTKSDVITSFSSSAPFLDFLAPGQGIWSSIPGGGFDSGAGTSFSAPHVAGAWAILKSRNPDATIEELREAFVSTGHAITDTRNNVTTARIQVDAALQKTLLPVELVRFEALAQEESIDLTWETAGETNNAGFELEHAIDDDFSTVAFLQGQGTVAETTYYSYRLDHLAPGWHRFRLKQLDFDGDFTYSLELKAFVDLAGAFHMSSAYPNPFNPSTHFSLTLGRQQRVRIEVFNLLGQRVAVLDDRELEAERIYPYTLDGVNLPSGIYLIQATGESFRTTRSATLLK